MRCIDIRPMQFSDPARQTGDRASIKLPKRMIVASRWNCFSVGIRSF